jgi:hypothetical protein
MMNIQEREEREYNPAGDLENAYAWNCMNRRQDDAGRVAGLIDEGKFVIVRYSLDYCPSTDACMGERCTLESVHDSRSEAEAWLTDYVDSEYGEIRWQILPPSEPVPVVAEPDLLNWL